MSQRSAENQRLNIKGFNTQNLVLKQYEIKTSGFCDKYSLSFFIKETVLRNNMLDLVDSKLFHWLDEIKPPGFPRAGRMGTGDGGGNTVFLFFFK